MSGETKSPLRLWPALVILAVQWSVSYYYQVYGATNIDVVIGNAATPLICTIALLLWWLLGSRAPWRDRFAGLAVFAVAIGVVLATHLPIDKGLFLLMRVLPALTLGLVAILLVTQLFSLPYQRSLALLYATGCVVFFGLLRVVDLGGDLTALTEWRWKAAPAAAEQAVAAHADIKGTATLPAEVGPGDWTSFRGPNRDGHAAGISFSTDWAATPPKELWRRPVGAGHSSISVAGDYLFTQEQAGDVELVSCYSAKTGDAVWTVSVKTRHEDTMGGVGPRATPTYGRGKVYAQSTGGLFQCLDASNGELVWSKEMTTTEDPNPPQYGFASSPLMMGDVVVQYATGAGRSDMAAFKADTGEEVWSTAKGTGGYGSPHLVELAGAKQLMLWNSVGLQAFDPANGNKLWEHVFEKKQFPRCVQPIHAGEGRFVLGANMDFGTRMVTSTQGAGGWEVKENWTNDKHRPYFNDNVAHKGALYGFDGNRLCCLDLATGETKWQGDRCGGQVMALPAMDLVLVLTEKGAVSLVKTDPAAYTEVASFKAITGKTWNHPVIANGKLYVRNSEEMACFELPSFKAGV
jgi:outer membrane protein assembly factor BamB